MTIAGLFGTIGVPGKIAISTFLLMSSAGINSLSGMSISPVADEQNVFLSFTSTNVRTFMLNAARAVSSGLACWQVSKVSG
ncbi:Uncharacterised protein [Shigella sonnei]|nr:Uncharacterised protein [Shigella sonnei]